MVQLRNHTHAVLSLFVIFCVLVLNLPSTKSSAPAFLTKPNNVTVKNGQNAVFKCEATGFPVPKISWFKNGVIVRNVMLRHYIGLLFKTLYIMPVYWSDAGQITCEASNKYGTVRAHAYLRVVTKTMPIWTQRPRNITRYEGQIFEIPCKADGFPSPRYTWTKGFHSVDIDPSITVSLNGDIHFAWASVYQSGEYTCTATNQAGSISQTIKVHIVKDPTIIRSPADAMGVVGQELTLQCNVVGNSLTNITWRKDGKYLDTQASPRMIVTVELKERTIHSHALVIQHARNSDSGKYQCVASNYGGTEFSKIAVVNLTGYSIAPSVDLPHQVINVPMNSDIKLTCRFTGIPLPQLTWLKHIGNAAIILKKTSGDPLGIDRVETTLEIQKVSMTDHGSYVCMGQNGGGVANGNITLNVQEDPRKPDGIPSQSKFKALRSTNTTLNCTFRGNPQPEVTWYRKGLELKDSLAQTVPGSNFTFIAVLVLIHVDSADTGAYECRAQNPHGKATMTVYLTVGEFPVPPTDLQLVRKSKTDLRVSWTPQSDASDIEFIIEYKHSDGTSWTEVNCGGNTTKMLHNVDGWDFTSIQVRARNGFGTSEPSQTLIIQVLENIKAKNPKTPERSIGGHKVLVGGAVGGAALFVLVMLAVAWVLWRKRKRRMSFSRQPRTPTVVYTSTSHEEEVLLDEEGHAYSYVPVSHQGGIQEPRQVMAEENEYETVGKPTSWEYPKRSLTMCGDLGKGHFGKVVKATLKTKTGSKPVAVKMLKENAEPHHVKEFLAELELMKSIEPHPNIVGLVGCCTKGGDPYIIVEYCSTGNLRDFLRKSQGSREYSNLAGGSISLTSSALLSFMWQVARGMSFLASKKLVHRDLAARNVLVNDGNVCKIADFGLARNIYQENQYLKTTEGELPLRWMALESIFHGVTTIESDVWSFGILMWEIITLGGNPYPGYTREQLISNLHLGYRMPRPPYCNEELYGVIWQCWKKEPSERPSFPILCRTLHRMMAAEKVLIDLVNFDAEYINAKKDGEPVSP